MNARACAIALVVVGCTSEGAADAMSEDGTLGGDAATDRDAPDTVSDGGPHDTPDDGPPDDAARCGPAAFGCPTRGATCEASERCTCANPSGVLAWECEPLACPIVDGVPGEPCATAGLSCDTGFEDPGQRCVGPELIWTACRYYHRVPPGFPAPPNGCPAAPPTAGAPCCQALRPTGGLPPGCLYGDTIYQCVAEHWVDP